MHEGLWEVEGLVLSKVAMTSITGRMPRWARPLDYFPTVPFGPVATRRETVDFILERLKSPKFTAKSMFGEYALYADGKVVALVCDDRLYVKDTPATISLAVECETGPPYPGAKPHYIVDEGQLVSMRQLPEMLLRLAATLPAPKKKTKGKK